MNEKVRITSSIVRVRSHFLVKLTDRQWAIAKHAVAAGETMDQQTIVVHLHATRCELKQIADGASLLGFDQIGLHAERIVHLIELFLEKGLGTVYQNKLLTDVILEINDFVLASNRLTTRPTVLENLEILSQAAVENHA